MNDEPVHRDRAEIVLKVLVWVGLALGVLSIAADWLGFGREAGFGPTQTGLLITGISLSAISGWLLRSGRHREWLLNKVELVFEWLSPKAGTLRWLVFFACLLTLGTANFSAVLNDSNRFREFEKADWSATNLWILSAKCARQTGAWLAVCDKGRLYPFAKYAADDPGHAFFLGVFSRLANKEVTFADAVRLNAWLAFVGFASLGALLFAMRSYVTWLVLFLAGGSVVFWAAPSDPRYYTLLAPHPSLVGVAAMAALLPISMFACERGWVSRRSGVFFVSLGLVCLGIASLVRQATGMMGLLVSLSVLVTIACWRTCSTRRVIGLAGLGLLIVIVWMTPRWVLLARDLSFPVEPTEQLEAHGMSHSMYLGLGAVENRFGIEWLDSSASEAVKTVAPQVRFASTEYYRILWSLYLAKVREDPAEVMRIYMAKARMLLGRDISDLWARGVWPYRWTPSLWRVLVAAIVLLVVAQICGLWRRYQFEQGLFLGIIALVFVALSLIQAALVHPALSYAAPIGLFALLPAGIAVELFCRWQWIRLSGEGDAPLAPESQESQ